MSFTGADVASLRALARSVDEYDGNAIRDGWHRYLLRESRLADRIQAEITGEMPSTRWAQPDWRESPRNRALRRLVARIHKGDRLRAWLLRD